MIRGRSNDLGNCEMGCYMSSTQNQYYDMYTNTARLGAYSDANTLDIASGDGTGNFFYNVRNTTFRSVRKNKTQLATKVTSVSGTVPNIEFYIGGRNDNGTSNIASLREISTILTFAVCLTDAECDLVSDLVDTYNANVISGGR